MNKTLLIIQREFLSRVKKKSFLIVTLLTPMLIAAIYAIPVLLFLNTDNSKKIQIVDESKQFIQALGSQKDSDISYVFSELPISQAKDSLKAFGNYDALVFIPKNIEEDPNGLKIFAKENVGFMLQQNIERAVQTELRNIKLRKANIDINIIEQNKVYVKSSTISLEDDGQEKNTDSGIAMMIGLVFGFILYMAIFIYGSQVMQGVIEEKTNRIVEVIISSVKPFQLLIGKIVGVGAVGLVQFILWGVLTFGISSMGTGILSSTVEQKVSSQVNATMSKAEKAKVEATIKANSPLATLEKLQQMPWGMLVFGLFFFFIGGYLLYSSLFAAVGSAVDNVTDAQQFMWPVTIPVIISIMLAQFTAQEPNGAVAFWASIIPFTSPINMVVRIPYGVAGWELALSVVLLILGFLSTTWLAAKIYRVGVLMYGKKPTFKELGKWIMYKN
jgi:ABC-2 type transport system permease protein